MTQLERRYLHRAAELLNEDAERLKESFCSDEEWAVPEIKAEYDARKQHAGFLIAMASA